MIPKIIHYCWFGNPVLPIDVQQTVNHWKSILPDYQIIQWDESNFDYKGFPFAKEAYEKKQYAFVSDFCRLYVLANQGGIYLDTDVEVIKPFDDLLSNLAFMGFEDFRKIGTSVIGTVPKGKFINEFYDLYHSRKFILESGKLNTVANVDVITNYLDYKGVLTGEGINRYNDDLVIYPQEYFSPKVFDTEKIIESANTYSIHHFSHSWFSPKQKMIQKVKKLCIKIIGYKNTRQLIGYIKNEPSSILHIPCILKK